MQQKMQQVREAAQQCIARAEQQFGVSLPNVQIRFDLKGRAAGMAGWRRTAGVMSYYLRFNTTMMANEGWDHVLNATVPHEVAHLVCYANPRLGNKHNPGWKQVCRVLGGNGQRCHSEEVIYAKGDTYEYTSTLGHKTRVSGKVHRNIQRGITYKMRGGKGALNNQCQFELIGRSGMPAKRVGDWVRTEVPATPVQQPAAPVHTTPKPTTAARAVAPAAAFAGASKADVIRARIADAKARGEHISVVVQFGVEVLGMTRALASTYAKNNWNKV